MLDFYGVPWQYEPRAFPIAWDGEGHASQYFTPDFFLPEEDLYIELTTMSQKLVTKKNAKLRRLRTLYPGVKCRLLYQRDYFHLVEKYGLEVPAHLPGQRRPSRTPGPPQVTKLDRRGVETPV